MDPAWGLQVPVSSFDVLDQIFSVHQPAGKQKDQDSVPFWSLFALKPGDHEREWTG